MQRYNYFLKLQYFSHKKCMNPTFFDVNQRFVCEHKHLLTHQKGLLTQKRNVPENAISCNLRNAPLYFPI